jgi:hypothetical protein
VLSAVFNKITPDKTELSKISPPNLGEMLSNENVEFNSLEFTSSTRLEPIAEESASSPDYRITMQRVTPEIHTYKWEYPNPPIMKSKELFHLNLSGYKSSSPTELENYFKKIAELIEIDINKFTEISGDSNGIKIDDLIIGSDTRLIHFYRWKILDENQQNPTQVDFKLITFDRVYILSSKDKFYILDFSADQAGLVKLHKLFFENKEQEIAVDSFAPETITFRMQRSFLGYKATCIEYLQSKAQKLSAKALSLNEKTQASEINYTIQALQALRQELINSKSEIDSKKASTKRNLDYFSEIHKMFVESLKGTNRKERLGSYLQQLSERNKKSVEDRFDKVEKLQEFIQELNSAENYLSEISRHKEIKKLNFLTAITNLCVVPAGLIAPIGTLYSLYTENQTGLVIGGIVTCLTAMTGISIFMFRDKFGKN